MKCYRPILICMLLPVSLVIASDNKRVEAYLIKGVTYSYEQKSILQDTQILIYDDYAYIPLSDVEQLINKEITYEDKQININNEALHVAKESKELEVIKYAIIEEIDKDSNEIIVSVYDQVKQSQAELVCSLKKDVQVIDVKTKKLTNINQLKQGMVIALEYRTKQNLLKGETIEVTKIALLANKTKQVETKTVIQQAIVTEVNQQEEYIAVLVEDKIKLKVYMDRNTIIRDTYGNVYKVEDIKINQRIKVITNGIMTQSEPKETVGLEVIFL